MGSRTWLLALAGVFVVLTCAGVRIVNNRRIARDAAQIGSGAPVDWISFDPDGMYHMRRLERALQEGGRVAARDPLLDYPRHEAEGGAPIPWPPYMTHFLWLVAKPFAPAAEAARRQFVEELVGTLPMLAASLTGGVVFLAVLSLSAAALGLGGALLAGIAFAFSLASIRYSFWGMGDHHAFVSLLHGLVLLLLGWALEGTDAARRKNIGLGIGAGLLLGLAIGTWVASWILVIVLELSLLVRWIADGKARRGQVWQLAPMALALHLAAATALFPAALHSPFPAGEFVNLSIAHPCVLLALGLFWIALGVRRFRSGLWLLVPALLLVQGPLRCALASALDWALARNPFMASVRESRPIGSLEEVVTWLGWGAPLLVFLIPWALWHGRRGGLATWGLAALVFALLTLAQQRFAEGLAAPLCVLLGAAFARVPVTGIILVPVGLALGLLAQPRQLRYTRARLFPPSAFEGSSAFLDTFVTSRERALREVVEWLRGRAGADGGPPCVLAQWDLGHLLEWGAGARTVGTQFGSYLGEDSFLDPWRVLLAEPQGAQELLEARRVDYVLITSTFPRNLRTMLAAVEPEPAWVRRAENPLADWQRHSLAGHLLPSEDIESWIDSNELGSELEPGRKLGTLRLVHVSPTRDGPFNYPAGLVYERVAGAELVLEAAPGTELIVRLSLNYDTGHSLQWWTRGVTSASGVARVRVPYATQGSMGDAQASGPLHWSAGAERGTLRLTEQQVRVGAVVTLD